MRQEAKRFRVLIVVVILTEINIEITCKVTFLFSLFNLVRQLEI